MTGKVELLTPLGGKVILDPTNTAVDRVLTLPAVAGTVLNTASDIESQVKTATSATGDAPIFSCRAWVNFNGTGTVAIRASGNVSSITDNGTGTYTVNFTTAMPDANYSASVNIMRFSTGSMGDISQIEASGMLNSSCRVRVSTTSSNFDPVVAAVAIFR